MKKHLSTIILIFIFLVGLSLLLYPSFSDYWNSFRQSQAISSYEEQVATLDEDRYAEIWQAAAGYNASLLERPNSFLLSEEQIIKYNELLNVSDNGIMGYIEIPSINCVLPIYHGTSETILQVAVGHLEWSSLPVGGESSHCVISGHRGLPSAKLFTDLDKVTEGDIFMLRVLDEILTYEIDQIRIVEPQETDELLIEEGEDYCTLVTCTPYGINTHRLLVRGHRIENREEAKIVRVTADAVQIDPLIVAPVVGVPMLFLLMVLLLIQDNSTKKKRKRKKKHGGDIHVDIK